MKMEIDFSDRMVVKDTRSDIDIVICTPKLERLKGRIIGIFNIQGDFSFYDFDRFRKAGKYNLPIIDIREAKLTKDGWGVVIPSFKDFLRVSSTLPIDAFLKRKHIVKR